MADKMPGSSHIGYKVIKNFRLSNLTFFHHISFEIVSNEYLIGRNLKNVKNSKWRLAAILDFEFVQKWSKHVLFSMAS